MSRKKKSDPSSTEYWEEILKQEGLSMDAGVTPMIRYAGSIDDLAALESAKFSETAGCGGGRRTRPKPQAE